ncbi:hypothetical protein MXB_1369 [Myxobolus squamalis]|nr:hypothetical protein MXB_1369 [Myxobolus squamalis]
MKPVVAKKKYKNCDYVIFQCSNSRHLAFNFEHVAKFDINTLLLPLNSYSASSIHLKKAQRVKKVLPKVFKKIKSKFGDGILIPANLDYQYCKSHLTGVHGEKFKLENERALLAFAKLDIFVISARGRSISLYIKI